MNIFITGFTCLLIGTFCTNQQVNSVKVSLSMANSSVSKFEDFLLTINISTTDSLDKIVLPGCPVYEYHPANKNSDHTDGTFEMQCLTKSRYVNVLGSSDASGEQCYDSLGNLLLDTLTIKDPEIIARNLFGPYQFHKGSYRIRIKVKILKQINTAPIFVYSDWLYFLVATSTIKLPV